MDATDYSNNIIGTKITSLVTPTLTEVTHQNGMRSCNTLTNGHGEDMAHHVSRKASNGTNKAIHSTNSTHYENGKIPAKEKAESQPLPPQDELTTVNVARSAFRFGPDQVIASQDLYTISPNGRVRIELGDSGVTSMKPISVPGMLHKTASNFPNVTAMATKNSSGTWDRISFKEYEKLVRTCAKAFLKLGLKRYHSVAILGFNSAEWFISDLGAIYAGGFAAGIYTTNGPDACCHCALSSRANIIVVQDQKQLDKILEVKDRLPELKAIIQYQGKPTTEGVLSWDDLMKIGEEESDTNLDKVLQTIAVNECCTLIYTSGTVGNPKAVMLSHDNLTWAARASGHYIEFDKGNERGVSFLPLSHVAAQLIDLYVCCTNAITIYFADPNALKGSLVTTLQEVRPTTMLAVPRVWEKIEEKMRSVGGQASGLKKALVSWAKAVGLQHTLNKMNKVDHGYDMQYKLANALVFRKVKNVLGLEHSKYLITGAAPMSPETLKYFWSLDIVILEGFGMSETSGCHTINKHEDFRLESIGKQIPGMQTKIHNPDEKNQGEILMKGRNIFMGYLNDIKNTQSAIDEDGWLHSEDVGTIDKDGFVYITGRIKELLITAGGENIPPVLIEHTIRDELPCISNAVVIGDKRKYLTVLLTLKTILNQDTGEPLDELAESAKTWCHSIGCSATTVSDILAGPDKKVMAEIQLGIDRANLKAISNAQKVQKFTILPKDFSMITGEMGPTMKLKRKTIYSKYADIIENFYK